jgi:hypothetical protein
VQSIRIFPTGATPFTQDPATVAYVPLRVLLSWKLTLYSVALSQNQTTLRMDAFPYTSADREDRSLDPRGCLPYRQEA